MLVSRRGFHYTCGMGDELWVILAIGFAASVFLVGRQWYRRRRAGKLADDVLREVVKGKDAFRR